MKALIPAAGLGTRWYPWSRVVPKELIPVGRYPAIHYVLEEAIAAELNEIGIIISEPKILIKNYIEAVWKSEHPEVKVKYFFQQSPHGVADALLCAHTWVQDEPTAIFYPDEIHPLKGGMIQLRREYECSPGIWIGLTEFKQTRRQAILKLERIGNDKVFVRGPSQLGTEGQIGYGTGRYILSCGLNHLNDYPSRLENLGSKEFDDDKFFEPLWGRGVRGIALLEPIYDVGNPKNWAHCVKELLKREKD